MAHGCWTMCWATCQGSLRVLDRLRRKKLAGLLLMAWIEMQNLLHCYAQLRCLLTLVLKEW